MEAAKRIPAGWPLIVKMPCGIVRPLRQPWHALSTAFQRGYGKVPKWQMRPAGGVVDTSGRLMAVFTRSFLMPDYDLKYLNEIAGFSPERKRQLLRFFASQNETVHLETFFLMQENLKRRNAKTQKGKLAESHFACFLVALDAMLRLEEGKHKKGELLTKEKADQQFAIRLSRVKARKPKSTKVKRLVEVRWFDEIKRLHEQENLSWRKIAEYIARYHKAKVSFAYLREAFLKVKQIREG